MNTIGTLPVAENSITVTMESGVVRMTFREPTQFLQLGPQQTMSFINMLYAALSIKKGKAR